MNDRLKKVQNSDYFPLIPFLLILCLVHAFIKIDSCDDVAYAQLLNGNVSVWQILYERYMGWSSRFIIEFVLLYVVKSATLWKALNIFMYLLLALSLSYLLPGDNRRYNNSVIALLLLVFPLGEMASAGWVATSTGYFWTIALGTFTLTGIKRKWENQKFHWYDYVLYTIALLYASNHEQSAFYLFAFYASCIIYGFYKKKSCTYLFVQLGIIVVNLSLILLAPGNELRKQVVIETARPDYYMISLWDKLYEAYADTMNYFIFHGNWGMYLLALVICFLLLSSKRKWYEKLVGIFPVVYLALARFNNWGRLEMFFRRLEIIDATNAISRKVFIPIVISAGILLCIVLGLLYVYGNTQYFWVSFLLLSVGMLSRIAVGLTGSVMGSAYRTISFLEFSIIIVLILMFTTQWKALNRKWVFTPLFLLVGFLSLELIYNLVIFNGTVG